MNRVGRGKRRRIFSSSSFAKVRHKPAICLTAIGATVCNLAMKQACAFEDNLEFQSAPDTTTRVLGLPKTTLACRHNETAKKHAIQPFR
jgi:hypothetical protein